MQLVLDTHGLTVKQRKRCFLIIGETDQRLISPERVTSIAVTADCLLSTAAIRLAVEHQIPIFLHGKTGAVEGKLWSPHFVGLASLRRGQALWLEQDHLWIPWGMRLAHLKTSRQLEHLQMQAEKRGLSKGLSDYQADLNRTLSDLSPDQYTGQDPEQIRQRLLGLEGSASRGYWDALSKIVPPEWRFDGRTRRPAQDPFNAALNYLYGMLYPTVEHAVFASGLDPYMGVLHTEEYDRPALAFDLIEPFRPWVDALLVDICYEGTLDQRNFELRDGGCWVGKAAKAILIPRFNDFLLSERVVDDDNRSVRNHIHAFAGAFAENIFAFYEQHRKQ
jgi:CRISPR-associated protein Cas1